MQDLTYDYHVPKRLGWFVAVVFGLFALVAAVMAITQTSDNILWFQIEGVAVKIVHGATTVIFALLAALGVWMARVSARMARQVTLTRSALVAPGDGKGGLRTIPFTALLELRRIDSPLGFSVLVSRFGRGVRPLVLSSKAFADRGTFDDFMFELASRAGMGIDYGPGPAPKPAASSALSKA